MSDEAPEKPRPKRILPLVVVICLALAGWAWWQFSAGAGGKQKDAKPVRAMPVAVAEAAVQDVEVFLTGLGTVTPLNSVTVKSRVDGQLMQVLFREGQTVKVGQLLLVIDSRPFQVQLAQAEGQLRRDQALLDNARLDLKRYDDLIKQGAIARQQLDTQLALVKQYEGAVITDKAQADAARLQITYCRITAPVSGQVGLRQVDPGNMVRSSDSTGLLVVNQLSPITVLFTLPEDQLPRVLAKLREGAKLRVDAYDREQTRKLAEGELASLDNQIDSTTGTVRLKASFANAGGELYPNQFVNAKLLLEVLKGAVVIPAAAVQRGQQGSYVFVVGADNTVKTRPVSVGEAGDGRSVVLNGLSAGEKVVVEGAERLRDGAAVEVRQPGGPAGKGANGKAGGGAGHNVTAQNPAQPAAQVPAQPAAQAPAHPATPAGAAAPGAERAGSRPAAAGDAVRSTVHASPPAAAKQPNEGGAKAKP
jgi:multidrug efflux system membrane fusion protein